MTTTTTKMKSGRIALCLVLLCWASCTLQQAAAGTGSGHKSDDHEMAVELADNLEKIRTNLRRFFNFGANRQDVLAYNEEGVGGGSIADESVVQQIDLDMYRPKQLRRDPEIRRLRMPPRFGKRSRGGLIFR